jgi:hypothetical protein
MQNSMSQRSDFSVLPGEDQFDQDAPLEGRADGNSASMPHVYRPCKGTWVEFVGDIKRFFAKMGADLAGRVEDIREVVQNRRQRAHRRQVKGQ